MTERCLIDGLAQPETRYAKLIERGLDRLKMALGLGLQEQAYRAKHWQPHLTGTSDRTGFVEQDHVNWLLPGQRQGFAFAVAQ